MSGGSGGPDLMVGNRPLSSLRVVDLKQELEKRGLSKSGSKKDLADRLRLHLQIEQHRDSGASADEEELPNYSVHEELADQNPFIRDYLASQAELFHSQKVVKKLVEEEAKRESETSADEGVDSPVKQPPPPTLEREGSPVATEPRRQSRRRTDSQREEFSMTAEKLVTRSSRSRSPAAATESQNNVQVQNEQPKKPETEIPPEKPPEVLPAPPLAPESAKIPDEPVKLPEPPQEVSVPEEAPETSKEADKAEAEATHLKTVISDEPEKMEIEKVAVEAKQNDEPKPSSPLPIIEAKSPVVIAQETKKEVEDDAKEGLNAEKEESAEVESGSVEVDNDARKNGEDKRSRSSSPIEEVQTTEQRREPSQSKEDTDSKVKDDSDSSSEDDDNSSRSRDRSKSRSRSRSRSKSRSRSRSVDSRDDSRGSRGDDSVHEKKSEVEDDNEEESRDEAVAVARTKTPDEVCRSRSSSRSPIRESSPVQDEVSKVDEDPKVESEAKPEKDITETEEKKEKSSVSKLKDSSKEAFVDLTGEEALDYGEEEEDEERAETDKEFNFTRRNLRFKSKNNAEVTPPSIKWSLEMDTKFLVVKSKLLNKLYQDIKLIPLELLKLEEKSSETSEDKGNIERKASISQEFESDEPLPTRTVENVQPVFKRTVSIVPTSKIKTEVSVEADKTLTPPRNPQSSVLLITNLTRPFTLPQLKEMLQRTGKLVDIWVDKIKSKCIARFDSEEEAFETRAALHGVRWPSSNPKSLHVDYTTQDNLDDHKAKENGELTAVSEKPVATQPVPVREWDMGKKAEPKSPGRNRKRSRSPSDSRDRDRGKRSRRTPSPGKRRHSRSPTHERRSRAGEGKEPEPMGKALDELFKKTIAAPSIYWLPLTAEQIAEKEELRRKRMLERERRLAELSKMRPR